MDCRLHHFSDSSQTSGVYNLVGQSVAGEPTSVEHILVETISNWIFNMDFPYPTFPPCSVNSNLDLIVSATDLLKALHVSPGAAMTHPHLSSLEDLQELVSYSMQHCAGTERFFTSQEVFEQTVQAATTVNHKVGHTQEDVAYGASLVPWPRPLDFFLF